jgi:hypothetical protein
MRKQKDVESTSQRCSRPLPVLAVLFGLLLLSVWIPACATTPGAAAASGPEKAFARGKALLLATEAALGLDREPVNVGMGALTSQQYTDLTAARVDLLDAAAGQPGAAWEPQARLLAARALDYGRLQLFPRAIEEYRELTRRFPDSPEAAVARTRVDALSSKFDDFRGVAVPKQ